MARNDRYLYQLEMEAVYVTSGYGGGDWFDETSLLVGWLWRCRSTYNGQITSTPHERYRHRGHCVRMVCRLFDGAVNVSPCVKVIKNGKLWGLFDRRQLPVVVHKL